VNNNKRQFDDWPGGLARGLRSRSIIIGIYLFLVAISLAVFGQTVRYDFVNFDDDLNVYKAPAIQTGLTVKGLALAFTSPHARNWHPLTTLSHMLDCQLYGLNAGGHHATNILLHTLAVLLLFRVLQQMTGALWKSALVAALFAVHPLHVESVAWVSERKDVLSAVFFLLILDAYFRYTRARSVTRYLAVVMLLGAGLMSKSMLVSVPVILLLLDYWPLDRIRSRTSEARARKSETHTQWSVVSGLMLEKIPLLLLSAGACAITFVLQKRATGAIPPLPFLWRIQNAFATYVIYVWETLWPVRLAVFYPHPNDTLRIWEILLAIGLLLAMTIVAIAFRRKRPYLFTGWLWYVGMLLPVIGLVQVGEQGHADRYTYLPHIGLFVLAVWLVADVTAVSQRRSRVVVPAAVIIVVLALAWTAFIQASYWRNSETLWTHALAVTSNNDVAHNNLGHLCADRGELDKAISHFETALRIRSSKRDPHYSVGSAFVQVNLANALSRKGQPDEAIVHYDEAIESQPNYADAYYNRGNVLFAEGRIDEAMADWEKTLELRPDDPDAHTCLGNALLRRGSVKEAVAQYENAIALAPEDPHSRINMAWVLATAPDASIRDGIKAVEFAQRAVELSGGRDPNFLRALAAAYAETGRFPEAITTAKQAMLIATMQGKSRLAKVLDEDVGLYREHVPLRATKPAD
jgi:tetratricopeptide (TPR) repeat protein